MNALLKIFSIGIAVTLLSHCSDEPDVQFAELVTDEAKHFAMGRVDLTSVCDSASVTLDDGSVLQGQMNCASTKLQPCSEELQTGCIVPSADELNSASNLVLVSVDSLVAANIKNGVIIGNVEGTLEPDAGYGFCTGDGQVDCVATTAYKSAEVANITADDLKDGKIIAGIGGTLPECSLDGDVGCVTTTTVKAAVVANIANTDLKNGKTIAGITGTLGNCAIDGGVDCVANASYKAADMSQVTQGNIKNAVKIAGITGNLGTYTDCTADGGIGCITTNSFKAAHIASFSGAQIKSGTTIAGVAGTLLNCTTDGGVDCVATASFSAANMAVAIPGNIKAGVRIAGVPGSVPTYDDCDTDGGFGCVATPAFKAAEVATIATTDIKSGKRLGGVVGVLATCSAIQDTDCVADTTFPAIDPSALTASTIRSGTTIAGVAGTLADCSSDGDTECVAVDAFKAADMGQFAATDIKSGITIAGRDGTVANCTGDLAVGCITTATFKSFNPTAGVVAGKVRAGTTIAGVAGTLPNCSTDGQSSACVIAGVYKAVDGTNLSQGNIKKGVSLGGLTGDYPSTTHPLPDANLATQELNTGNLNDLLADSDNFEFWDAAGVRHTGNGSDDLDAGNVKLGVNLFGVAGSMVAAAGGAPDAWDIRKGTTVSGVAGELDTSCGKVVCNGSAFQDVSTDSGGTTLSPCDSSYSPGTNHCMYKDRITNLTWTDDQGRMHWDLAKSACEALTYGGRVDWRLPTATELLQMMNHGMRVFNGQWQGSDKSVWTENDAYTANYVKAVIPFTDLTNNVQPPIDHGIYNPGAPTDNARRETICVHSP